MILLFKVITQCIDQQFLFCIAIVLHWFILRRRQFSALLHSSGTGLTKKRYIRLMLLSFMEILMTWPLNIYVFAYNIKYVRFQPYKNWNYVHEGFGMVYFLPYEGNIIATKAALEIGRWAGVAAGIVFFGFFGLSKQVSALKLFFFTFHV